jgi:hypothetical protein
MVDRAPLKVSPNVRVQPRCSLDSKALNLTGDGCSSIHSIGRSGGGPKSVDEQIVRRARKRAMALGKPRTKLSGTIWRSWRVPTIQSKESRSSKSFQLAGTRAAGNSTATTLVVFFDTHVLVYTDD